MVTFFKKVKKILTIIAKIIIPYPSSIIPLELDIFYPCLHLFIKMKEITVQCFGSHPCQLLIDLGSCNEFWPRIVWSNRKKIFPGCYTSELVSDFLDDLASHTHYGGLVELRLRV